MKKKTVKKTVAAGAKAGSKAKTNAKSSPKSKPTTRSVSVAKPGLKSISKAVPAPKKYTIDLNCDMGEGMANEKAIFPYISSANIACGYHAGDEKTIWESIKLAKKHKVAIGAHPSYLDKENFGRKDFDLPLGEIYELIIQQLLIFNDVAFSCDCSLDHVKPHGALYNLSAKNKTVARTIARAIKDFDDTLILFGLSGSHSISEAKALGLQTANEVFADRTYQDNGLLTPRSKKNALIDDVDHVVEQALQLVKNGSVTTLAGKKIKLKVDTICIHGDHKNAGKIAKQLSMAFQENRIEIKSAS